MGGGSFGESDGGGSNHGAVEQSLDHPARSSLAAEPTRLQRQSV